MPYDTTDFEQMAEVWEKLILGAISKSPHVITIAATEFHDSIVEQTLYDTSEQLGNIYASTNPGDGHTIYARTQSLRSLAVAYRNPISRHHNSNDILETTNSSIESLTETLYSQNIQGEGNWWEWTIGTPQALMDTCLLMRKNLKPLLIKSCIEAVNYHIPDPTLNRWSRSVNNLQMRSANLADQAQSLILGAILGRDEPLLRETLSKVEAEMSYASSGDGLHEDGSYIFHSRVPYNGTYGCAAFRVFSRLSQLVNKTSAQFNLNSAKFLDNFVSNGLLPFLVYGTFTDVVRGRAVTRETGLEDSLLAISDIAQYAKHRNTTQARLWSQKCKWALSFHPEERLSGTNLQSPAAAVTQAQVFAELIEDESISPYQPQSEHRIFSSMARSIHSNARGWTASISMSNTQIAHYEHGNNENLTGYHSGSGMLLIHRADDPFHFSSDYWKNTDPNSLPGTTVQDVVVDEGAGGPWAPIAPENRLTGGHTHSADYAVIALDMRGFQSTVSGQKSWLFLEDMIVCLGAGIKGGTGNIQTTVENRVVRNGVSVSGQLPKPVMAGENATLQSSPAWLYIENLGGYIFHEQSHITNITSKRFGCPVDSNVGTNENYFLSLKIDHGVQPTAESYAYALLPNATSRETEKLSGNPRIFIVENSTRAQVVYDKRNKVCLAAVYRAGTYQWLDNAPITLPGACTLVLDSLGGISIGSIVST